MAGIADYSSTAASNTAVGGVDIQGSAAASNIDNALRAIMADIATALAAGTFSATGYVAKSAGYTVLTTDRGKMIDCTATLELDLPAAATAGAGFMFWIKANGGAVTVDPDSTENINGASTSATIVDGSIAAVVCTGTAWHTMVAGNVTLTGTQTLTNKTLTSPTITTPTLTLKQSAAPAPTAEGDIQWDTGDDVLVIGDGAAAKTFVSIPASTAAGDIEYYSAALTKARLAKGTAGQVLRMNSGATAPEWGTALTLGTATASTSGTAIDFTGLPAGTKRVTVTLAGVSTSGTDDVIVQIGDAGGPENSGYVGSGGGGNLSDGFQITSAAGASATYHGAITMTLVDAATFTWVAQAAVGRGDSTAALIGGGSKSLTAELTQVRITTSAGSDTFDAGKINIAYE